MNQQNKEQNEQNNHQGRIEKKHNYFYKITNLINGKYYYGIRSTNNEPEKDKYMGSGVALKRAIKKYGKKNFKKEIIALFFTRKDASDYEKLVVTMELISLDECYNCRTGGDNGYIYITSEETKLKLSKANKGKKHTEESKRRMSEGTKKYLQEHPEALTRLIKLLQGKNITEHTRQKMRENNLGKKQSEETIKKRFNSRQKNGKPWFSEETRKYLSEISWLKKLKGTKEISNKMSKMAKKTPCLVEGFEFESVAQISRVYQISVEVATGRLKSKKDKWKNWRYI